MRGGKLRKHSQRYSLSKNALIPNHKQFSEFKLNYLFPCLWRRTINLLKYLCAATHQILYSIVKVTSYLYEKINENK